MTLTSTLGVDSRNSMEYIHPAQFARYFGISRQAVNQLLNRDKIPYIKVAGSRLIPQEELQNYRPHKRKTVNTIKRIV